MVRVLSAAVLVALLMLVIWWLPWWATAVFAIVAAALAGREVAGLATAAGGAVPSGIASLAAAVSCLAFLMADPASPLYREGVLGIALLAVMLASALAALAEGAPSPAALTRAATLGLVPLYVGLPLGALAWTRVAGSPEALTWLLLVVATSDTGQFYTGRLIGRRKLAPVISPGKTVEGAIGGLVVAAIAGGVSIGWALDAPVRTGLVLGALLALAGMAGDLFESLLKRSAGAKDSSGLIPGHGGVLDRIDSHLFAAPLFYLYLKLVA